jgi:23S rRNA-/tRNA-specific pseudouridylate synthase
MIEHSNDNWSWSHQLATAYEHGATDGIQELLVRHCGSTKNPMILLPRAQSLWEAVTVASQRSPGTAASMLNAILAFACDQRQQQLQQHTASTMTTNRIHSNETAVNGNPATSTILLDALELFDIATICQSAKNNPPNHHRNHSTTSSSSSSFTVQPNVVTYSLLYTWLTTLPASSHDAQHHPHNNAVAESILAQSIRASHKEAGSVGRKARAAARRRARPTYTTFREAQDRIREWLDDPEFAVLYEDSNLVVVNKPAGVSTFHTHRTAAGQVAVGSSKRKSNNNNNRDVSLHDALVATGLSLSTLNPDGHGLVHRLDRGTSGCQCWAKNDATHARLVSDFIRRRNHKTYQCLVKVPPQTTLWDDNNNDTGTIDWKVQGRPALSQYRVLQRYTSKSNNNNNNHRTVAALLQVETFTGRKHQVRIHCAQGLGCPIWGDDVYGIPSNTVGNNKEQSAKKGSTQQKRQQRFHLHAATLQLPLLGNDHAAVIEAPLPSWWGPQIQELQQEP